MNIIIGENFNLNIYGFSGTATNGDYTGTAFKLMGNIWPMVKQHGLKTKGLNIWVYEPGHSVFAGIELYSAPPAGTVLELKNINLAKYAYYKHIGPYDLIKQAGENMREELKNKGFTIGLPYIEIYGHWDNDETKLETELLMTLQ
jgi:effector-binding domain-containing protein